MKKHFFHFAVSMIVGAFILGACGSAAGDTAPTSTPVVVEAIYTAAAQTVIAKLTQQAPTITPTPVFTNTPKVTATPLPPQPTSTKAPPTPTGCANFLFIDDITIPDGMQLPVNQEFTKTWRVKNTGTCTWTSNFKLAFSYGELMGGQTVPFTTPVQTGQTVDISVKLKVPDKTGKLTGVWTLLDDKGEHFGKLLTVVINVGALTPTPTGSATATPTGSPTSNATPTSTSTPTETPVPSETPTITLTPTP